MGHSGHAIPGRANLRFDCDDAIAGSVFVLSSHVSLHFTTRTSMSASPATSYGTIRPTRRAPSLRSFPDDDEAFAEALSSPSPDGPGALRRGLSARQVQMIAIGGTIGTGLFLGTGRSLAQGGPASMLICYSVVGFIVYVTLILLGEIATQYPIAGECLIVVSLLCLPRNGPAYHSNSLIKVSQHIHCTTSFVCLESKSHLAALELILIIAHSPAFWLYLPFSGNNFLTFSLARRILQCLCHQVFLPSLRIRPLMELLVQ